MKINNSLLVRCIVGLVLTGTALGLLQLWFSLFAYDVFCKLMITLVVLGVVVSFLIAVKQDLTDNKKLKDDKYLD
jgi:hypothetical protein